MSQVSWFGPKVAASSIELGELLQQLYCDETTINIIVLIYLCMYVKDESVVNEASRPNSSQPVSHYDPLDLDSEDLFVKYKVHTVCQVSVISVKTNYCCEACTVDCYFVF